MDTTFTTHSAEETRTLGIQIAKDLSPQTLICLRGDLGAGKTTFVQGLLEGLRADRPFVSPTFVIMKQYDLSLQTPSGIERVYHADAYRVGEKDFRQIGFAEWLADRNGLVVVEWPERIAPLLPEKRIDITLTTISPHERGIRVKEKAV